jgi:tetratricopeptide (TPR) repeat protein
VLSYDEQRLTDIIKGLSIFTNGVPPTGSDRTANITRGYFVNSSVIDIAQYLHSSDAAMRAQLLQDAHDKMFLVLSTDPTNAQYRYNMGMVELILGHPQMAVEHLEVASLVDPHNFTTAFALGLAYIESGQPQAAVDTLRPLYIPGGASYELQEVFGDAALLAGDATTAISAYDSLLRDQAYTDWQLYAKYLGAAINTGRYHQALDTVNLLLTNHAQEPKLYADRAGLQALLGNAAAARADYDKAASLTNAPDASALLTQARNEVEGKGSFSLPAPAAGGAASYVNGLTLQAEGKNNEATTAYQQVLQGNATLDYKAAAYANLVALYAGSKQYDQATALFKSGLFDISKAVPPGAPFYPYVDAAYVFEQAGQLDNANAAYARALDAINAPTLAATTYVSVSSNLASNPLAQRGLVHSLWADTLARNSQDAAAIYHYRLALDSWPASYATWHNLALAYNRQSRTDLAEAAWLKAVAINPDFAPAAQALAGLSYSRGDLSGGEFALAVLDQRSVDRWNFSANPASPLSSYLPAIGAGLPNAAPTPPDRRFIVFALLLIIVALASFFPGSGGTLKLALAWLLATLLTALGFLLIGPAGVGSLNLLHLFYPSNAFLTFSSPLLLIVVYAAVALLTAALLYGVGGWVQQMVARRLGLNAAHDFSLPGLSLALGSVLVGGFFLGPLTHLRVIPPAPQSNITPSRRERLRRAPSDAELAAEQAAAERRLALPALAGLGFGLLIALLFLILYLISGLPILRFAALIAAAWFAAQAISGLGALGEDVVRWSGWYWLPLALLATALYSALLTGIL